jgi:hypothetical protein
VQLVDISLQLRATFLRLTRLQRALQGLELLQRRVRQQQLPRIGMAVHGVQHAQQLLFQGGAAADHVRQLLLRICAHLHGASDVICRQRDVTNHRWG